MKFINPVYQGENKGHYSMGVQVGNTLYVSGQLSIDPNTREVASGGIKEHTQLALANVERVINEAGLKRENIAYCRVFITDVNHWNAVNEEFKTFFGHHKPGRVVVPVPALHFGCLIEIEAIAEVIV